MISQTFWCKPQFKGKTHQKIVASQNLHKMAQEKLKIDINYDSIIYFRSILWNLLHQLRDLRNTICKDTKISIYFREVPQKVSKRLYSWDGTCHIKVFINQTNCHRLGPKQKIKSILNIDYFLLTQTLNFQCHLSC